MRIVKFKIEHALSLDVRPHEEKIKNNKDFEKWAKLNEESIGFSGFCDEKLIGCAGVRKIWDGVGEAWFLASSEIYNHSKSTFKNVRDILNKIIKDQNYWRVQAHVRTDNLMGIKFIQMLGFVVEGKMVNFNIDKTDAYLFART